MSRTLLIGRKHWLAAGCGLQPHRLRPAQDAPPASYYDNSGHPDAWSGGARMVAIATPKGNSTSGSSASATIHA